MNRAEYMKLLEIQLKDIPQAEKMEALQYYNDYFDDAGVENEASVMNSLGSPAALAETIRRDFAGNEGKVYADRNPYHQKGYGQNAYHTNMGSDYMSQQNCPQTVQKEQKEKMNTGLKVILIILLILASPLLLAFGLVAVSVVVTLIIAIFSIILALAVSILAVILALGCVVAVVIGLASAISSISPFSAVVLVGACIILVGLCIFLFMGVVWLFGVALPGICRGIGKLFKKIFTKKGGK